MLDGLPVCICRPLCDKTLKARGALCGTDGQKYRNYCALQRLNCLRERQVKVEYYGRCRSMITFSFLDIKMQFTLYAILFV
jgi:hypothetical protein